MDDAAQYDASDPVAADNAAKEQARREAEDAETFRLWMAHPKSRDLLWRIVYERCHLGETFTAMDEVGRSDPLRTYLHIGERNIGAWIDAQLRGHPNLYMKMLQEQAVERDARQMRLRKQAEARGEIDG